MFKLEGTSYSYKYYFIECNTLYVRAIGGALALKQIETESQEKSRRFSCKG